MTNNNLIRLNNVRIIYPHIIEPDPYVHPGSELKDPKYNCTFILDKETHAKEIADIIANIDELLKPLNTTRNKIIANSGIKNMALKDGDLIDENEYEKNAYILRSSTYFKPQAYAKDGKTKITDNSVFYGGCFVNAFISVWAYPKKASTATGVSANLICVQFVKDGEPLQSGGVNSDGMFTSVEDPNALPDDQIPF